MTRLRAKSSLATGSWKCAAPKFVLIAALMVTLTTAFSETGFAQDEDARRDAAQTALKQADMVHARA